MSFPLSTSSSRTTTMFAGLRDGIGAGIFPTAVHRTPTVAFHDESSRPACTNSARRELLQLLGTLYNWSIWGFMFVLLVSQVLGAVWNSSTSHLYDNEGRTPELGVATIPGLNENPFSDRLVVCALAGRQYKPAQLRQTLLANTTTTIDTTGSFVNGFRVIERNEMSPDHAAAYATTCDTIASTLDNIIDSCTALGYNVTDDTLRIVDDIDSAAMKLIPNALPVLIMPFWDKSLSVRYAIPGHDGSACVFRLEGIYEFESEIQGFLRAASRAVRDSTTAEWLTHPGGRWRNGWYEDTTGTRWYSDLLSTVENATFRGRFFDMSTGAELDCSNTTACAVMPRNEAWGAKLASRVSVLWYNTVTITNGAQLGLHWHESNTEVTVTSEYDLETLISNIALGFVMVRWLVCMLALSNGHRRHTTRWCTIGIGSMACARNFHFLPIVLTPRLKTTLAALFTVGCKFQGSQSSLSENWFVMYPAVCEFMLFYYSLLNILAKMLRRRVSDVLFGPTLLALCLLHYLRAELAAVGAFGIRDGHVPTVVQSNEFRDLRLVDYLRSGVARRLNGDLAPLLALKLALVAVNALPLAVHWQSTALHNSLVKRNAASDVEKALAVRAPFVGGLGRSTIYECAVSSTSSSSGGSGGDATGGINPTKRRQSDDSTVSLLSSYEVVRLGYIVLGGEHLISIADWHTLFVLAPARHLRQPPNFRVTIFTLVNKAPAGRAARMTIDDCPHVCRLNDPRLRTVSVLDITACPLY